ncbi:MAG TPA: hypothetical protein VF669_03320 [Tepidisphaeraceae bacterium]|jgi:hypothetical protein
MSERVLCDLCGTTIPPHAHYIIRMDVFADPSMPEIMTEDLEEKDLEASMQDLINQMKKMTEEELLEQVHKQFEFKICRPCQVKFIANPLGKPRETQSGRN